MIRCYFENYKFTIGKVEYQDIELYSNRVFNFGMKIYPNVYEQLMNIVKLG